MHGADTLVAFFRRLRIVFPMLLAFGIIVLLGTKGGTVQFRVAGFEVTYEALAAAIDAMLRLLLVATASLIFTLLVPLSHAIAGLRALRIPSVVIAVAWLTERFLSLLAADLRGLMDGVRVRSAALRLPRRVMLATRISASFLVRAVGRSERMADAMIARGFDGTIPRCTDARWTFRDSAAGIGAIAVIAAAIMI